MSEKEEAAAAAASAKQDDDDEKNASIHDLKTMLHTTTCESNGQHKTLWQMTKETLGMADGSKTKSTDILVESEKEGLEKIKIMIQDAKKKDESNPKKAHPGMWEFQWTPIQEFHTTLDNILLAFLRWTRKDNDDSSAETINVTKAFHRLESYAMWMYDARNDLEEPLTVDSIKHAAHVFGMKLTHSNTGVLLWWLDMEDLNLDSFKNKEVTVSESLRYFVWVSHVVILDTQAQANGMIFIEDLRDVGFWKLMTAFPGDLGAKLDRLTIGVLPIQMKACYVLNADGWMKLLLGLMKAFMSKKMKQRIIALGKKENASAVLMDVVGGPQNVPVGCCGLEGTAEKDIIFGTYITDEQ